MFAGGSHPATVGTVQKFIITLVSAEEGLILKHYGVYLQLREQPVTFQNNRGTARTRYAGNNLRLLTQLLRSFLSVVLGSFSSSIQLFQKLRGNHVAHPTSSLAVFMSLFVISHFAHNPLQRQQAICKELNHGAFTNHGINLL